jgi:hypothetical protein
MAQVMRGIHFSNSNIVFDVQMRDPAEPAEARGGGTVSNTFSGISTGWQVVGNAAIVLAEASNFINKTGRLCENGRYAPVERYDWLKWSRALGASAWNIYQAALEKDQAAVGELTNNLAEACDNCHRVYRNNAQGARLRCLGGGIVLP